jgi:broad specificity phosphatase PhoE
MRPRAWHHLDELFAGACDGMTYEEIEEQYPEEFQLRENDKLAYRYPRGESYLDVIARLEPIIMEMERHREPLLIVGHQGTVSAFHLQHTALAFPHNASLHCTSYYRQASCASSTPSTWACAELRRRTCPFR